MDNYSGGQLINLISNDGTRLEFSVYFVPYLVVGPIQAVAITYIMARTIDVSILSGLAVLVVAIPTQSLLGKLFDRLRYINSTTSLIKPLILIYLLSIKDVLHLKNAINESIC